MSLAREIHDRIVRHAAPDRDALPELFLAIAADPKERVILAELLASANDPRFRILARAEIDLAIETARAGREPLASALLSRVHWMKAAGVGAFGGAVVSLAVVPPAALPVLGLSALLAGGLFALGTWEERIIARDLARIDRQITRLENVKADIGP